MKKHLILLFLALMASAAQAQDIFYRNRMRLDWDMEFMQQRDGDFIIHTFLMEETDIPGYAVPLGHMFYKASPDTFAFTDSLFVEDTIQYYYMLDRDPRGEGNFLAALEYHDDCDSSFLRICHFPDGELAVNHQEDLLVPVCDGTAYLDLYNHLVDSWGDIIIKYTKWVSEFNCNEYLARIGPDGTMKHQAMISENASGIYFPLRELKASPLQYYQWKETDNGHPYGNLAVFVMDSLFNKNTVIFNSMLREEVIGTYMTEHEYLIINANSDTEVIPVGEGDILVAAQYCHDTNNIYQYTEFGVAVAKYDMRTMQLKKYVVFNDYPGTMYGEPRGLKKMTDGTVYFLYWEQGYPRESVIIVKMDTDLNVEWKRFCKTGDIQIHPQLEYPVLFEDSQGEEKGIAWRGYGMKTSDHREVLLHFFLNHDGIPASVEGGMEVRPYAFYPNPARSELHLQYSPDVQPARIELYDVQGRLVQTQTRGLETLRLEGLAAGQYLMKVTLEDGQAFTDKVVKE